MSSSEARRPLCGIELARAEGRHVNVVDLRTLSPGSVIKITTASGNIYLIEVVESEHPTAHLTRFSANKAAKIDGYLGIQEISPLVETGKVLEHKNGDGKTYPTKPIVKLELMIT